MSRRIGARAHMLALMTVLAEDFSQGAQPIASLPLVTNVMMLSVVCVAVAGG